MDCQNTAIKEVIREFPKIGELLSAYGVDCVTCAVGTCLLKDVLDIHNFQDDKKKIISAQIAKIINGEEVDIIPAKPEAHAASVFCKPIQQLVDEHKNILRLLDLAQYLAEQKEIKDVQIETLKKVIRYVKNYADKYHHAKEENILFKKAGSDTDIVKAMLTEHGMARDFIKQASEGIESNNQTQIKQAISGYINLLREHIRKEDKILYPWFENTLTDGQKADLQKECDIANDSLDKHICQDLLSFLDENYS